ncbi:hypothetical protein [Polymorphospora rubra]|uniref:hypothetical protein n=1 Tax=Polymorphospora rubra TaxID=338584 RepID=UPI00340F9976
MDEPRGALAGMSAEAGTAYVMENDLSELFAQAEVVRERRPAKMVTTLGIDLDIQVELERAAAARGIGASTLMRQIIEERVTARRSPSRRGVTGETETP